MARVGVTNMASYMRGVTPGNRKGLLCVAAKHHSKQPNNPSKPPPCPRSFDHDRVGENRTSFEAS